MRLQKYLADAGIASRRKCEELILAGRVEVNGDTAKLGMSVEPGDRVLFDGREVAPDIERVVIAFYKPKNVICSNAADEDRIKVEDYFKELPYRLYTVGRLDYDSEGLILVTNDGELANRLTHPRYGMSKTYMVLCTGHLSDEDAYRLTHGVELEDGLTAPAELSIISGRRYSGRESSHGQNGVYIGRKGNDNLQNSPKSRAVDARGRAPEPVHTKPAAGVRTELLLTIHEGRNRQVRRMLAVLGHETLRLRRVSIGGLGLGNLKPGQWRFLSEQEIRALLE